MSIKYKLAMNYKKYKRFDAGGGMNTNSTSLSAGMGIAQNATGIVDGMFGQDQFGRKPMGVDVASDAVKGASMGMAAGPYGAAAGALVGAGVGFFTNRAEKRKNDALQAQYQSQQDAMMRRRSEATIASNPSLVYGHQYGSFYAMGGQMETANGVVVRPEDKVQTVGARAKSRPLTENYLTRATKVDGGSLSPLSSDSVAVNGPSHAQGGVQLSDQQAEVEGGETMKGNFVFSDQLGFAKEHKRLASAIGRIQAKEVQTPERVNSIRRMQDREKTLALSQEYMKHIMYGTPDPTQQQTQPA